MDCAESLLEQNGYVRSREVIAIVAGTRTRSGSTNFLRLHVMGDSHLEGERFHVARNQEPGEAKPKRPAPRKSKAGRFQRYPSPNPPEISNP